MFKRKKEKILRIKLYETYLCHWVIFIQSKWSFNFGMFESPKDGHSRRPRKNRAKVIFKTCMATDFSTFKSTFSNILTRLVKSSGKSWMHFNGKLENDDITSTLLHIFIWHTRANLGSLLTIKIFLFIALFLHPRIFP